MTDPYDTPTGRWGLIFYNGGLYRPTRGRQEWAQLADAIATADLLREGKPGARGDDAWCQVAVDTYTRLHHAGAYSHLLGGDEPRWHAEEHLIRAWLHAPVVPPDNEQTTMLDAYGWPYTFDPTRAPDPADMTLLVDLAQADGVVGASLHKVSLLRWVDDGVFRDDALLIVLWPPDGPARASSAVSIDDLLPPEVSAADRIVGLLTSVASVANRLLSATDTTPPPGVDPTTHPAQKSAVPAGHPTSPRGRAFQVIHGGNAAGRSAPAPLRAVANEPTPPQHRRA